MNKNRTVTRWIWGLIVIALICGLTMAVPSIQVHAGTSSVQCTDNNLRITWSGLNIPVTVRVDGVNVVQGGATSGTFTVAGPGDWTIELFENGDPVNTYNTSCPAPIPPTDDPRKFPNTSNASTTIAYKLNDGGFDLYMYSPFTRQGLLIFRMTCNDETASARQAEQRYLAGLNPNVVLYQGLDAMGHPITVYFVFPDQIQINGYFGDGKAHNYSFPACVNAHQVELATRTPTPIPSATPTLTLTPTFTNTPLLPIISLSASCTVRGNATYRITNTGGDMLTAGNWVVTANGTRVGSDTFRARSGGVVTITSSGIYGNITFTTDGGGTTPQSVSTFCNYPTATPTRTPTFTPVPPNISLSASCTVRGNATYRITNNGGDMQSAGNWVVFANGSRVGSDTFRARSGGVVTITSSGIYGVITFTTSGGGTTPQSVSTFCQHPTATPTATPR